MEEVLNKKDCIITFSNKYVNLINPTPEMFNIKDIAHSLSLQCRWTGHVKIPYSIAQHSLWVCNKLEDKNKLSGLMHDASEAYISDISRIVKEYLPRYKEIEDNLMKVIANKFGFEYPMNQIVKKLDDDALMWEWNKFILPDDHWYSNWKYKFVTRKQIEQRFLNKFNELTK